MVNSYLNIGMNWGMARSSVTCGATILSDMCTYYIYDQVNSRLYPITTGNASPVSYAGRIYNCIYFRGFSGKHTFYIS